MASTTPQERLNKLFSNQALPTAPTPGQPHFSEKELEQRAVEEQRPWSVPETAQYPRDTKPLKKQQPQRDIVILTSSDDDDDYVSSFKKKPSMKPSLKPPQPRSSVIHANNASTSLKDPVLDSEETVQYIAHGERSERISSKRVTERSDSDNKELPTTDKRGIPVAGHFCQFHLAAKFPYKYMNDVNDRVSRHFFASNKFYNRTWDLYYLHPPASLTAKAIILVPFEQVQELIAEIGKTFKIPVSVPPFPFTFTFFEDGTPKPQYLGQAHSKDEAQEMQNSVPTATPGHGECPHNASSESRQRFEDFKHDCQAAILAAGKTKGGRGKKKVEYDRLTAIRDWYVQLRRAQRYLGLRRKTRQVLPPNLSMTWEEQEQFRLQQLKSAHVTLDPLDLSAPAPYAFEEETVFIAVDIESHERAHNLITEIGISTLDTLDLVNVPPGPRGRNWTDQIRSRHFRIRGREHLVNKDFCRGDPNSFQFGRSEWVELEDATTKVDSCFEWPFSVDFKHPSLIDPWSAEPVNHATGDEASQATSTNLGGTSMGLVNIEQEAANRAAVTSVLTGIGDQETIKHAIALAKTNQSGADALENRPKQRKIILVGHSIGTDVAYLRDLGSKIFTSSRATYPIAAMEIMAKGERYSETLASIIDSLDTAPLFRILKEETQNRNLASIMGDLGLPCYFLHNAGNDARYTLEALVAMLIEARLKGDQEQKKDEEAGKRQKPGDDESGKYAKSAGPSSLDGSQRQIEELDAFEAAVLASSGDEASPRHQRDEAIAAITERLKLDPTVDEEEPRRPFC
ncbi:hypothetical protein Z517_08103 [Fonsecaea pedrosoi CBS 271.37]|uniref:Gfd2/YDR514C-like C-terminal domain-containing protein n=1 Tax=Fonsecaea pedrosoi CBS 271.37 TaxID=1442368 RepID=A0A0D2H0Q3_9EURO|nr:uncharacterized protein Z517_08103 [Fonsecaea pedrosoi CBS 271.37]KIW78269.1 hypothetical protein Z517_08103 [Fonsecaea pedrosoi CBS 271.37]